MSINLENYEAWLTDYIDGNLSEQEKALVEHFLSVHPELEIEKEDLELDPILPVASESFPYKNKLKKESDQIISSDSINKENYDEAFIAFHENLVGDKKQIEIAKFIEANPSLRDEFKLYGEIKFTPDPDVIFPNKSILKRRVQGRRILWLAPLTAAAAGLALILVFSTNNPSDKSTIQNSQDITTVTPAKKEKGKEIADIRNDNSIENQNSAAENQHTEASTNLTTAQNSLTFSNKRSTYNESKLIADKDAPSTEKAQLSTAIVTRDSLTISTLPSLELAVIELPTRQIINNYQNPIISALRLREKKNTLILAQQNGDKGRNGERGFKVPNLIRFAEKKLDDITSNNESDFRIKTGRTKSGEIKSFSIGGEFLKISHSQQ